MRWTAQQLVRLDGRRVVVTGANSGIGLPTAAELARHGACVTLACRRVDLGRRAAERIRADNPAAQVEVAPLDLARMSSVREFADTVTGPVDLLVNNAGVMAPPKLSTTSDGYELQFGTNHLGHFALTGLLLPALLAAPCGRVVTVSSVAHRSGTADVLDANMGRPYRPQRSYGESKLANLLFAFELQRRAAARGLALTSTAAHPGLTATHLLANEHGAGANRVVRVLGPVAVRLVTQSASVGARPTLYAATAADPGSYTGPQWLGQSRGPVGPATASALARDPQLARRLWEVSEELTGLRYPWP